MHEIHTKEDAKREALAMWRWLMRHPRSEKRDYIYTREWEMDDWACACALCEYSRVKAGSRWYLDNNCKEIDCPLSHGIACGCEKSEAKRIPPYVRWNGSDNPIVRFFAALEIVLLIKKW